MSHLDFLSPDLAAPEAVWRSPLERALAHAPAGIEDLSRTAVLEVRGELNGLDAGDAEIVPQFLEHLDRVRCQPDEGAGVLILRIRVHPRVRELYRRRPFDRGIAAPSPTIDRLNQHGVRALELAYLEQRIAEVVEKLKPSAIVRRQQRGSALQEIGRGGHIAAAEGAAAGGGE